MPTNEKKKIEKTEENAAPAKRGRPRKVPTINKIVDEYALTKSPKAKKDETTASVNTQEKAQQGEAIIEEKKTRGRRRSIHTKETSPQEAPQQASKSDEGLIKQEKQEKQSAPRRGRPQKKVPTEMESTQQADSQAQQVQQAKQAHQAQQVQQTKQAKQTQQTKQTRQPQERKEAPLAPSAPSPYTFYKGNLSEESSNSQNHVQNEQLHERPSAPAPYRYDDDNSPIQLLPSQLAQKNSNRHERVSTRSKVSWQQKEANRNQQRNENNNSNGNHKHQQKRNQQKNKSFVEPAFDNSSIIAAITGKNFESDNYSYNDEPTPSNINPARINRQANLSDTLVPNTQAQIEGDFSFLNPQAQNGKNRKVRIPRKATSSLLSASIYEDSAPKPLNALPTFAESALNSSHLSETQSYEPIIEEKPKPKKPGRPKKVKEQEVKENPRNNEYLLETKPEQSRHNEQLKMFVSVQPDEQVEVVLTENGTVVEYFVEMAHHAKMRGNIYKATIHNVEPNLQAAFVNFGAEKNGFLQIDEVHPDYYINSHVPTKNHRFPLVSKALKPGQELLVQIVKEPNGSKGAFLTTWISLAGRFLVLTPGQEQLGVSRKVTDPQERERLRAMLDALQPGKDMGVIIRTAAINATTEELQADLDYLQRLWVDLVNKAQKAPSISLIHQEVELTQRVVRDYLNEDVREIWTDDKNMAGIVSDIASIMFPQKKNIVKYYSEAKQNLLERFNLQKQIDEITAREIHLPSGGRVTFDQTEALMAIDINSGKTQGKANFQAMVLQTNLEAAKAIARHLRLRDIGGQVVIDFIELRDKSTIKEVENIFKLSMKPDRARYEIGHISTFGLLELVRQRIGSSAISISTEPCPHCRGTGIRRNMEWQAQDALKEITKKAKSEKSIKFVYTTDTELALYLLNHKRDRIQELEDKLNLRIEIQCQ